MVVCSSNTSMNEGGIPLPSLQEQKNTIFKLCQLPLKTGETWYLIDPVWFKQWKRYVGYDDRDSALVGQPSSFPGPIDNSPLLKDDGSGEIREQMLDSVDYELLPEEAWTRLQQWYTLAAGQQPIARKVIETGVFMKQAKVEVYLLELKLCENSNLDHQITKSFSKEDTIGHLERTMRELFGARADRDSRVWNRYTTNTYEQLADREATISSAGLYVGQIIVLEVQNEDGSWPRPRPSSSGVLGSLTNGSIVDKKSYSVGHGYISSHQPGLCGLSNLGNTCFMSSVLQCLSNTPPLALYFLENRHLAELNTENPLGMRGEIARAFGSLVQEMWSGRHQSTVPRTFKHQVSRFAPQFSGYQQHDSQEMLTFILDALHEDLNRIHKKPYIELRDSGGRPDAEVAAEAWDNYRRRNTSVIVDMFYGLLKSTVVCPECSKVSVTFDPHCMLQLPLPVKRERTIEVRVVWAESSRRPVLYKVTLPKQGSIQDLCRALERLTKVPHDCLVVVDVYHNKFHKIFTGADSLKDINDKDVIFAFETPPPSSGLQPVPVYVRRGDVGVGGAPFFVCVRRDRTSYAELSEKVSAATARYVRPLVPSDWWTGPEAADVPTDSGALPNGTAAVGGAEAATPDDDPAEKPADEPMEGAEGGEKPSAAPAPYQLQLVNSSANTCLARLSADHPQRQVAVPPGAVILVQWQPAAFAAAVDTLEMDARDEHESVNARPSTRRPAIQLSDCIDLFTSTEKLGVNDAWYCPDCKKHQEATKKFDLWSLPDVLIIHLKRFSYTRIFRDKIDALVEFPTRGLNMGPHLLDPNRPCSTYDLIGVSNHYGGMGGGHYVAYCKNRDDNRWYYFDDSSVTEASEDAVCTKAAYVLFYMRREPQSAACRLPLAPRPATVVSNGRSSDSEDGSEEAEDDMDCS
ncbi:ubiquitin carboxyl-terminal hydrolase 15-like [Amphibalanus amphitrite]|uniref:ubiquitin carboxyl-terminal hydrolase 15-like n=1 Tax=Amphibalanus amphitrite TaxID=1232801 RepID=UPI001C921A48|nr:ubiquitin carboxyl-terminal hydrolase 15-like [Amphibalanus amphitrite]